MLGVLSAPPMRCLKATFFAKPGIHLQISIQHRVVVPSYSHRWDALRVFGENYLTYIKPECPSQMPR